MVKYPFVLIICLILFFTTIFIKSRYKRAINKNKIANTSFIRETEYYQTLIKKYRLYLYLIFFTVFILLMSSALLSSRVISVSESDIEIYDRDIMLCLDVSGSMISIDNEIAKSYLDLVKNMHGERFGITIFDSSAYVLVPLTNDYDYVEDVLKKLSSSIDENEKIYSDDSIGIDTDKYDYDLMQYIYAGTYEGDGSSVVGDGFATCVLSFPKLEETRSRILILATDNSVAGAQIITVPEATKLAQKYKISVYPLSPYDDDWDEIRELKNVAKQTGGDFYNLENIKNTKNIISSIEKKEKTLRNSSPQTLTNDHPFIPLILIIISFGMLIIITRMVKL